MSDAGLDSSISETAPSPKPPLVEAVSCSQFLWWKGIVPFEFDQSQCTFSETRTTEIGETMRRWEKLSGDAITFTQCSPCSDRWLVIACEPAGMLLDTGLSAKGRQVRGVREEGSSDLPHELGRKFGLPYTFNREDRSRYSSVASCDLGEPVAKCEAYPGNKAFPPIAGGVFGP